MQLAGEQPGDLDGPDQEGGGDRQARDDDVVVHLAHRAGEGPAVGEVHEAPVQGVEQGHAPGEQQRQRQDGVPGQALGSGRGGGGQQQDLGGGVKADPEDEPDEEHVPGLGDQRLAGPKNRHMMPRACSSRSSCASSTGLPAGRGIPGRSRPARPR